MTDKLTAKSGNDFSYLREEHLLSNYNFNLWIAMTEYQSSVQKYHSVLEELRDYQNKEEEDSCLIAISFKSNPEDMEEDFSHEHEYKARLYEKITKFVKENESEKWRFSHIEEREVEERMDSWEDWTEIVNYFDVYAFVDKEKTEEFEVLYKQVSVLLKKVEKKKEKYINVLEETFGELNQ